MALGSPQKVAVHVVQVGSWYNNVYLDTQGNLITFGSNQSGRLGTGKDGNYFSKEKNTILTDITKFYYSGCIFAINKAGEVYMWGDNLSFCGGVGEISDFEYYINTPHKVLFE